MPRSRVGLVASKIAAVVLLILGCVPGAVGGGETSPGAGQVAATASMTKPRSESGNREQSDISRRSRQEESGRNTTAEAPPNIVVIMTDDQDDFASISVMPKLKNLLMRRGVRFTNSFADFALCCPSRASFLTGLAAHNHKVIGNSSLDDGGHARFIRWERNSLAVWLQQAGYTTGFMGKYMNGYGGAANPLPPTHVPRGWTEWYGMTKVSYFNHEINENGVLVHYGTTESSYSTDVLAQKADDFIERQADTGKPFFLLITPKAPHSAGPQDNIGPAVPAPRHAGAFADLPPPRRSFNEANVSDKPGFVQATPPMDAAGIADATAMFRAGRESLLAVDDMIETVVAALGRTRQLDNTVVIFTSDNGFLYGEHRLIGKRVVYEESIRVPLIMRGPGIPRGDVRTQMVNTLDLVATIVDLAGAMPGVVLDGRSLMPLIQNSAIEWRTALLVQGSNPGSGPDSPISGRFFAVRTPNYVYAQHKAEPDYPFGTEKELYDLAVDPAQRINRAGDPSYGDIVANLHELLTTLKSCSGDSCWVTGETPLSAASSGERVKVPVYRGVTPSLYRSRKEYTLQQVLDE